MDNPTHFPEGHSPKYWKRHPELLQAAFTAEKVEVIGDSTSVSTKKVFKEPTVNESFSEWRKPLNRADSIAIFGMLMGIFFVLIVPTVWHKIPAFVMVCFGFAYLVWLSHWTYRLSKFWRGAIIVVSLALLNIAVVPQFIEQWRTEYMRSELTFDARAPGLAYPDGDHYGIKWFKSFSEVRLTINSKAKFPIQNLNLSIWTVDKGDSIGGMAQAETEPQGCAVRRPRGIEFPQVVLLGQDGSKADISPFMNDQMNTGFPIRDHYDILCQRILAGEKIPLVIATITSKQMGEMSVPPLHVHIKGDYETTAAEGSKRVPVDEIVTVSTLPRWK
jgi:hypothetical protein